MDETFGCDRCWPAAADAAWQARGALGCIGELIDESHFHVMVLACAHCTQRFVSVFTETIDWVDSEDPQYWTLLPITEAEAGDLARQRDSLAEWQLNALGPQRRSLRRDFPKGAEEPSAYWSTGLYVSHHD